jgi:hypothetical protein
MCRRLVRVAPHHRGRLQPPISCRSYNGLPFRISQLAQVWRRSCQRKSVIPARFKTLCQAFVFTYLIGFFSKINLLIARNFIFFQTGIMALLPLQDGFEGNNMQSFVPGLFDRLDADDNAPQGGFRAPPKMADEWKESLTRDLAALLNSRSALLPNALAEYPEVSGSVVNYSLIDFAGMCQGKGPSTGSTS